MIPAHEWNRQIDEIRKALPITFTREERGGRLHPWQLSPAYDDARKRWTVRVHPGFVNGGEVEARIDPETAPDETRERLAVAIQRDAESVRAWLTEGPDVPLSGTRLIGAGAGATGVTTSGERQVTTSEPVPEFFLAMGVREARPLEFAENGASASIGGLLANEAAEGPARLLRACDVTLRVTRVGIATNWQTTQLGAQLDLTYITPPGGAGRASVFTTPHFVPPVPQPIQEQLSGGFVEPGVDEILLGTVYLISPEDATAEDIPDGTWEPFAQHFTTWNLSHAGNDVNLLPPVQLRFPLPLLGGIAQPIVDTILGSLNTAGNQTAAYLAQLDPAGRFWTS